MGNNAVAHSGDGKFVALEVGHCPVISMERQNNDIFFDVDIYDRSNKLIARIAKNEFHVITGESVSVDRQGDLTRLIVKDNSGKELLNIHRINEDAIQIEGVFGCQDHRPVVVKRNEPIPGFFAQNLCAANSVAAGIFVQ